MSAAKKSAEVICPHCHQPTKADAPFCGNCGKPLTSNQPTPMPTPDHQATPTAVPAVHPPMASVQPPTSTAPIPVDQVTIPSMGHIKEIRLANWIMIVIAGINCLAGLYFILDPDGYITSSGADVDLTASDVQLSGAIVLAFTVPLILLSIMIMRSKRPAQASRYLRILLVLEVLFTLLTLFAGQLLFGILCIVALISTIRGYQTIKKLPQI